MNNEKLSEQILYPEIARELKEMVRVDQEMRKKAEYTMNDEDSFWDADIDKRNTLRLKEIITKIGWPNISKVGKEGSQNAWLIVQHADLDVDFQNECLTLMKAESPDEVIQKNIGYLEDRVRLAQGKRQIYGTQFVLKYGVYVPRPIEDEESVNEKRSKMGMETIEENTKLMNER